MQGITQVMFDEQKYHLLKKHQKPSSRHIFPTQFLEGCNRAFKPKWFDEYMAGDWCTALNSIEPPVYVVLLFTNPTGRRQKGVLVNAPLR